MALFKISKGLKSALPTTYNEGYCYFTTDDGKFYIDTTNAAAGRICLNAAAADKFSDDRTIALTGNVTGTVSGTGASGWSIATTIASGAVTNAMLAGSIANDKLINSSITIAGNIINLGGSITIDTLKNSLGYKTA